MRKLITLLCIGIISASLQVSVYAELNVGEEGQINSSVIFGEIIDDENDITSEESTSNSQGKLSGGRLNYSDSTKDKPQEDGLIVNPFDDVSENDWFYSDVMYAYENKIMSGVSESMFSPKTGITRAMMITILYRMAGEPEVGDAQFSDVEKSAWYAKAVAWGAMHKIVSGVGDNKFSPNADITREQLAVMLLNYRKIVTVDDKKADISSFADSMTVSDWAKEAMSWAVGNGIINGKSADMLKPGDGATRAEAAAIIKRFKMLEE